VVDRRRFLKTGVAVVAAPSALSQLHAAPVIAQENAIPAHDLPATLTQLPPRLPAIQPALLQWQQKVRRVGQTNMTEHDPAVMDVNAWADYGTPPTRTQCL